MRTILMILALMLISTTPAMALGAKDPHQGNGVTRMEDLPPVDWSKAGSPWDNFHNALRNIFCKPDNPFRDPNTPSLCDI